MASPSHLKPLYSPHVFSMKPTSPASSLTSMKLKTLVHNFFFPHLYRLARTITKAKSLLIEVLKEIHIQVHFIEPLKKKNKYKNKYKNKNKNKLFFGSFRLHYNWCSSHVVPVPSPLQGLQANQHVYNDSTWSSMVSTKCDDMPESQLTGYLHWLEEKGHENPSIDEFNEEIDEIDKLADKFIANCHEKFRLEKIESYRKYQEMMARSV